MKPLLILFILCLSIGVKGQFKDTSYFDGCNWTHCDSLGNCMTTLLNCSGLDELGGHNQTANIEADLGEDSLQAERFFVDSIGNQYMVLYKYLWDDNAMERFPANCDIVKYKGNKQETVVRNFKAMYTLKETPADNTKLWLQRLYKYNKSSLK